MNKTKYNKIVFFTLAILLSCATFFIGVYAAQSKIIIFSNNSGKINTAPIATKENTNLDLFFSVWNTLREKSIHYDEATDDEKVYGAIAGLASSLGDPYTVFMPPKEAKQFNESITGKFDGIGAEIDSKDNILTVISPLKDSPAAKAGLKAGDKIVKIDGISTADMSVDEAITHIRGKKGTVVILTVYRTGETDFRTINITRDTIVVKTIETETIKDVYVIHINSFGEDVSKEFRNAITNFKKSKLKYMVIDLRGNPGGYLESAIDIASYFLPEGTTVVTEDFVKEGNKQVHTSYGYDDLKPKPKVIVLVDGGSASASEILAGALKDNKFAKLVGTKTFGKGSVQELLPMQNDTYLKVTVARWLVPSGKTIDKNGINPDVEVKRIYDAKNPKKDNQMDKAIELVKKQ